MAELQSLKTAIVATSPWKGTKISEGATTVHLEINQIRKFLFLTNQICWKYGGNITSKLYVYHTSKPFCFKKEIIIIIRLTIICLNRRLAEIRVELL